MTIRHAPLHRGGIFTYRQSEEMFRATSKKLVRPACGDIIGDVAYRRWSGSLVISNITDPIYDLRCRRGHSTLRTTPQIARAGTQASGDWVSLG
jgi:hypothetical protein